MTPASKSYKGPQIPYVLSREQIDEQFDFLCDTLEEGCGCGDLGNASRCIMLTEYIALCELREMAIRAGTYLDKEPE